MKQSENVETKILLEQLQTMLERYGGTEHIAGVRATIRELDAPNLPREERVRNAGQLFRRLLGGMGTLGDFAIWHESEKETVALNQQLNALITQIWEELQC